MVEKLSEIEAQNNLNIVLKMRERMAEMNPEQQ